MKTLLTGDCDPQNIFTLVDPTKFSESEFEAEVRHPATPVERRPQDG